MPRTGCTAARYCLAMICTIILTTITDFIAQILPISVTISLEPRVRLWAAKQSAV
jgi:hypothetical protein